MPRRATELSAETLLHGLRALLAALCSDDVVLMGRWSRVLAQVHAAPPAERACGA